MTECKIDFRFAVLSGHALAGMQNMKKKTQALLSKYALN